MDLRVKAILKRVREILSVPEHWIKGDYARDEHNMVASFYESRACKFCAKGAVFKAAYELGLPGMFSHTAVSVLDAFALKKSSIPNIVAFNDAPETKHEDLLGLIDEALA